jgi:hypothetical protein
LSKLTGTVSKLARGFLVFNIIITAIDIIKNFYIKGFTRESITKSLLIVGITALVIAFPIGGSLIAIGYSYLDDSGVIDNAINKGWSMFDNAIRGLKNIKYEVLRGINDFEKRLKGGLRL